MLLCFSLLAPPRDLSLCRPTSLRAECASASASSSPTHPFRALAVCNSIVAGRVHLHQMVQELAQTHRVFDVGVDLCNRSLSKRTLLAAQSHHAWRLQGTQSDQSFFNGARKERPASARCRIRLSPTGASSCATVLALACVHPRLSRSRTRQQCMPTSLQAHALTDGRQTAHATVRQLDWQLHWSTACTPPVRTFHACRTKSA